MSRNPQTEKLVHLDSVIPSKAYGPELWYQLRASLNRRYKKIESLLLVIAAAQKSYCSGQGYCVYFNFPRRSSLDRTKIPDKEDYCVNCRKLLTKNVGTKNKRRACKTLLNTPNCCEDFFRPRTPLGKFGLRTVKGPSDSICISN